MSALPSEPEASATDPGKRYVRLLNLLAAGQIALFVTTALWVLPWKFPQVPLFDFCRGWPVWMDVVFFVAALAGTFFAKRPESKITRRVRHAICAIGFAGLFAANQHRLQPWAYQFLILHAWLALARPRWMLTGWRCLTISIYVYSAWSKVDFAFCLQHGPFLLNGFLQAIGIPQGTANWPENFRFVAAAAMPAAELLTAMLLCFQRTQRMGLVISILMHLFLIVALGPWGHDHSLAVLIWNAFFIVQNILLFPSPIPLSDPYWDYRVRNWTGEGLNREELPTPPRERNGWFGIASKFGWLLLAIALLAPLQESTGLWDHWPSWAVYAARPEKVAVFIHKDDLEKLPAVVREHLQDPAPLEPWHPIRLDRWSLAATKTPIYPQARFHVGVALALAERHQLTTLRIVIDGSPDRWSAKRKRQEYVGLDAIEELASTYRFNARPR